MSLEKRIKERRDYVRKLELIDILIDNFEMFTAKKCSGLCYYVECLYAEDIINEKQRLLSVEIINSVKTNTWFNRLFFNKHLIGIFKVKHPMPGFHWVKYEPKPRLNFLKALKAKYLIKLN